MLTSAPPFYLQVAVPSPLHRSFDYLPATEQPLPELGMRVLVPFGRSTVVGIIVDVRSTTEIAADKLRPIAQVLDEIPLFNAALLALYRWASSYYLFPLGMALQTSIPKALREGKALSPPTRQVWQLTLANTEQETAVTSVPKLGANQQRIVDLLRLQGGLSTRELSALLGKSATPILESLLAKHVVQKASEDLPTNRDAQLAQPALPLNGEQQQAFVHLQQHLHHFHCCLLEGITGSGKTEVYLQLIWQVLSAGKQVLVLVPEITLTPQTIERFASRFHARIVAFHSGLTDKQRLQGWLEAATGIAQIIIGTRSAVFTPAANLGLIVVDEEHDDSYKQQEGFRYSGRDVAIYRANQLQIPVVLGSATPSLESLQNALSGRYHLLTLSARAGHAQSPQISTLDMKLQPSYAGIAQGLQQKISDALGANQQVLLFLNRRGFAPMLQCESCGWVAECLRCERSYTLHQYPAALRCHHCDAHKPLPRQCPLCHSEQLNTQGTGTEQIASYLQSQFPDYPVLRIDRDTTRGANQLDSILQQIHSGIPCILVGTQMLAKGHHFPKVTLVGIVDADSGLFSADFRAQENLGQQLMQVAGRAGRSEHAGQVIVQSYYPQHPALLQLIQHGYGAFARQLLQERQQGQLPPFTYSLLLRAESPQRAEPLQFLRDALSHVQAQGLPLQHFGPMPSPFGKRAGLYRGQLLLQSSRRLHLQKLGAALIQHFNTSKISRKVRWTLDVDPTDFN